MVFVLAFVSFLFATHLHADEWDDAVAAANSGDYETALREFSNLAEAGDARAQMELGNLYFSGEGVIQDYQEALRWYRKAAEQDFANGQYGVAVMLKYGWGAEKNDKIAAEWFTVAAKNGNENAQRALGDIYYRGEGLPQDYKSALEWYLVVAKRSENLKAVDQFKIAEMYRDGKGTLADFRIAYMWLSLSSLNGFEEAANERDMLAAQMTPEDVSRAQSMARDCLQSGYKDCG